MPNIFDILSSKLELMRLENRYTKRRNRRSTFVSSAVYVDGEYIYNIPSPTGSSTNSKSSSTSTSTKFAAWKSNEESKNGSDGTVNVTLSPVEDVKDAEVIGKERERRWSGISTKAGTGSWRRRRGEAKQRESVVAVREVRWEEEEAERSMRRY